MMESYAFYAEPIAILQIFSILIIFHWSVLSQDQTITPTLEQELRETRR